MSLKKYYGQYGNYLKEHQNYFSKKRLNKDVDFLIAALSLKKKDKILDLACGHGRHTRELAKKGFDVEGLDFSAYLLKIARAAANEKNLAVKFYNQDVHRIELKKKYDKAFLFFSEFGLFNTAKVLKNVAKILKKGGLFLLDVDNVFRLIRYMREHPKGSFDFDFAKMELTEKQKKGLKVRYYVGPELAKLFCDNGLRVVATYGDYQKNRININSPRIILVGKKTAKAPRLTK